MPPLLSFASSNRRRRGVLLPPPPPPPSPWLLTTRPWNKEGKGGETHAGTHEEKSKAKGSDRRRRHGFLLPFLFQALLLLFPLFQRRRLPPLRPLRALLPLRPFLLSRSPLRLQRARPPSSSPPPSAPTPTPSCSLRTSVEATTTTAPRTLSTLRPPTPRWSSRTRRR